MSEHKEAVRQILLGIEKAQNKHALLSLLFDVNSLEKTARLICLHRLFAKFVWMVGGIEAGNQLLDFIHSGEPPVWRGLKGDFVQLCWRVLDFEQSLEPNEFLCLGRAD